MRQPPALLLWDGKMLEQKLRDTRVSADEVRAGIRCAGLSSLSEVRAVLLETNGEFAVIPKSDTPSDDSAFLGIARPGDSTNGREPLPANTPRASDQRLP